MRFLELIFTVVTLMIVGNTVHIEAFPVESYGKSTDNNVPSGPGPSWSQKSGDPEPAVVDKDSPISSEDGIEKNIPLLTRQHYGHNGNGNYGNHGGNGNYGNHGGNYGGNGNYGNHGGNYGGNGNYGNHGGNYGGNGNYGNNNGQGHGHWKEGGVEDEANNPPPSSYELTLTPVSSTVVGHIAVTGSSGLHGIHPPPFVSD